MLYKSIILVFILFSCGKKEDFSAIEIFGHGGNGVQISNSIYHDNSQESFDLVLAQNGCAGVEIDVQLSKDGIAWLYHDPYLENETNGKGCINSMNDSEILELKYKSVHHEELIRLVDAKFYHKSIYLDLKQLNYCTSSYVDINVLINQIKKLQALNPNSKIYVSTVFEDWITPFIDESFSVYYESTSISDAKLINSKYAISGFIFKNQHITKEAVIELKNLGKKVVIFEMRSPKGIRSALLKFPDMIQSDDVKAALIEKN